MVSDADRRTVYAALLDQLGDPPASILMELLPVTSDELARQSDLVAIRGEMAEVRGEMAEVRGEMAEVRGEMAELRAELKGEMAELRGEVVRLGARIDAQVSRFLVASVPMTLGFGGMVLAAAKLA